MNIFFIFITLILSCANLNFILSDKAKHKKPKVYKITSLKKAIELKNIAAIEAILANDPREAFPLNIDEIPLIHLAKMCDKFSEDEAIEIIDLLINAGADVNAKDSTGYNALMYIIENPNLHQMSNIVSYFLELDGEINEAVGKDILNDLLLHAIHAQEARLVYLLINAGAEMNLKGNGITLLEMAILLSIEGYDGEYRGIETLNALSIMGLDINEINSMGNTVLHFAVESNLEETVRFLLTLKIDREIRNKDGKRAIDITKNSVIKEILR